MLLSRSPLYILDACRSKTEVFCIHPKQSRIAHLFRSAICRSCSRCSFKYLKKTLHALADAEIRELLEFAIKQDRSSAEEHG